MTFLCLCLRCSCQDFRECNCKCCGQKGERIYGLWVEEEQEAE